VSRAPCGILDAASQNRDPGLSNEPGPRLCSAPFRKSYTLRCVRGTARRWQAFCLAKQGLIGYTAR